MHLLGEKHYLFHSCRAAFCTEDWTPCRASLLLWNTLCHIDTVVQKHLLPYIASQILVLWLGCNLFCTSLAAASAVCENSRLTINSTLCWQDP